MEIKIIKTEDDIIKLTPKSSFILEQSIPADADASALNYKLYNCSLNSVFDICPAINKTGCFEIYEAARFNDYVHFVSLSDSDDDSVHISLYRYYINDNHADILIALNENKSILTDDRKIKFFILSAVHVLIQYEETTNSPSETMMGHIVFSQKLYNLESGEMTDVKVEDFINNGINKIYPLTDSKVMIKTGYSYLEDNRYSSQSEEEAVIEGIFIVNTARLISELALKTPSIDMQLIYSAYFSKYILNPECDGDYIFFDVIDPYKNNSESVFYNYITGKSFSYKNLNTYNGNADVKLILSGAPHVLRRKGIRNEFLDLETQEFDVMFEGEDFVAANGKVMITSQSARGGRLRLNIYSLPGMDFITDGKAEYTGCVICGGTYYIYCRKK